VNSAYSVNFFCSQMAGWPDPVNNELGEESKMDINEAKVKYEEALTEKTQVLLSEIRRMICERPFLLLTR